MPRTTAPLPDITQASIKGGAVRMRSPAPAPLLNVSAVTNARIGPGIEATEKPMMKAHGKVIEGNLEPFPPIVNPTWHYRWIKNSFNFRCFCNRDELTALLSFL
jgi:hypothetical protein